MAFVRPISVALLSVVCGLPPVGAGETAAEPAGNGRGPGLVLEGTWHAVSMEDAGKAIAQDNVKRLRFEFSGKKVAIRVGERLLGESEITIDESTQPISIKMVLEGKPTLGILALKGDRLDICLSGSKDERPTKFASEDNSPNRMLIRFRRGQHEPGHPIYVVDADGGNRRKLDLPEDLACGSPDWSPDGKRIACDAWHLSRGETYSDSHITIVPVEGGEITDLGSGAMPSWSPDGKRIGLCRYNPRGVWVMNADGTNDKMLDAEGWAVDWSPTANEIAYTISTPEGANIAIVDPDKETRRTLLSMQGYGTIYWNLGWSPDGKFLCFIGLRPDGTKEVARVSAEGDRAGFKVLLPSRNARGFESICAIVSWGGTGRQILTAMQGPEDRYRRLYVLDAEGEKAAELFPGQDPAHDVGAMAWSRDGKRVALISWEP